ncbi:MAG: hypothetical protein ABFS39_17435 [Pseudomonadota bacterium]
MKGQSLKQGLLAILVGLLAVSWVGSVSGMPGWAGFQAYDKGFPGGRPGGDGDELTVEVESTTVIEGQQGYAPYEGFNGAKEGNYPGGRPNGK